MGSTRALRIAALLPLLACLGSAEEPDAAASEPAPSPGGGAQVEALEPHPQLAGIEPRPCDVRIRPSDAPRLEAILNGPGLEFCVEPGDYTRSGPESIAIRTSGSAARPRTLRAAREPSRHPHRRAPEERAILPKLALAKVSHWRIRGLVFRPRTATIHRRILTLDRVSDSILDLNWIDASALGQQGGGVYFGVVLVGDCDRNSIQRNLFTDPPADATTDVYAVALAARNLPDLDHDDNRILDNECRNWSCVALTTNFDVRAKDPRKDCLHPQLGLKSFARRTLVAGNDAWTSPDRYYSCRLGAGHPPDPERGALDECACTEAFFESKHAPGAGFENVWRGNRGWGARPGQPSKEGFRGCGGSGHVGAGFASGNGCHGHEVVADNRFWDVSGAGILVAAAAGRVRVVDNLVFDVKRVATPKGAPSPVDRPGVAIHFLQATRDGQAYRNRIVADRGRGYRVANAFEDGGRSLDARCNVVVDPDNARGPSHRPHPGVTTRQNFFYADGDVSRVAFNLTDCDQGRDGNGTADGLCRGAPGADDRIHDRIEAAAMQELCIEHRRWTGPEVVCVSNAAATERSPHHPTNAPECAGY